MAVRALPEDAASESESSAAADSAVFRFAFRGDALEYFKIWAVNVALTALTLGVFSAWAKVRTHRYFYAHTFLDGANFEYHARPLSILIARIFVVAVVVGGGYLAEAYLLHTFVYTLLLAAFLPWALVRGLSFNARNSSHRNIRFSFRRAYGFPYLFYLLMSLGVGVFALPWLVRGYHSFKAGRHCFGRLRFVFRGAPIFPYIAALWLLPFVALILLGASFTAAENESPLVVVFFAWLLLAFMFFCGQAILFLAFWRGVKTENGASFQCDFSVLQFAALLFVNFFASLLTLGLLHPWAKVRRARFLAERMSLVAPRGAMDAIFARRGADEGALGEEFDASEGFDFDAGLV